MPVAGGLVPLRRGTGRQWHGERIEQEGHKAVVAAQGDELDRAGVPEEFVDGAVDVLSEPARLGKLAGRRVDGRSSSAAKDGSSPRPIASTTESGTPCSRAMRACAHHSNSAFQRAPTVMIATSDSRRSIDVSNRSTWPSQVRCRPTSGACTKALNGPVRAPWSLTRAAPREPTMPSHTTCPPGPSSSRRR